ncbi:MAG TPA: DUF4129 domain-containing transglutaminase family protein, partial [Bacillaceae bacterium]
YTGKGWEIGEGLGIREFQSGEEFSFDMITRPEDPVREAVFDIKTAYPYIVYPYGFMSVTAEDANFFRYDSSLGKITPYANPETKASLKEYSIEYKRAAYSLKAMRETVGPPPNSNLEYHMARYTKLPDNFPDRVRELALQLTAEHDNWFDKAKAIEKHFQSGEFTYDQINVAVPEEDQDYVDQFLFETKTGYCDNFSTSMVTMLRSIGIPARWAKGYTAGTYRGEAGTDYRTYEVTNNEAHSWVEVLFPTVGWVPFEPTKGFDNFVSYIHDEENEKSGSSTPAVKPSSPTPPKPDEGNEKKESKPKAKEEKASLWASLKDEWKEHWVLYSFLMAITAVLGFWLYWKRYRWIPYVLIWNYKGKTGGDTFVQAYSALLKQLERFGVKKEAGQTLRDYAAYIDHHFGSREMSALTERYERLVYRGDPAEAEWEQVRQLWENLIKKTTG